jgi:class 3 adenylate cyclase
MKSLQNHVGLGQIARILKNVAEASQFQRGRDWKLRDAISGILDEVGADALIMRIGVEGILLGAFDYSLQFDRPAKNAQISRVEEVAAKISQARVLYKCDVDSDTGVNRLFCFPEFQFRTETGRNIEPEKPSFYCFVSGLRRTNGLPFHQKRWHKIVAHQNPAIFVSDIYRDAVESYCRAIQLAMLRRAEADSIFPKDISEKFWNVVDDDVPRKSRIRPWDADESGEATTVPTASLSFDLRQSTFAMDQAINKKFHADWLEGMVIILRQLTHLHGGVFDKFTGDGAISHFPVYSFDEGDIVTASDRVIRNSIVCAWDMIRAVEIYIEQLRPNLALRKLSFGPAVGVAFDEAQWSVDRVGNPIVVGRGVVHACRLSDGPSATIQMSNAVISRLRRILPDLSGFEEIEFISKEYSAGSDVQKTIMTVAPPGLGSDAPTLKSIVQNVFKRL